MFFLWFFLSWPVVVTAIAVFLAFLNVPLRLWRLFRMWRVARNVSGRPTHWFWGNLHQIWKRDHETTMTYITTFIQDKRSKITRAWIGPFYPTFTIVHSETAKKVLTQPKHREIYCYLLPWLGEGLLISQGKKWARNRRLLTPAFHYEILKPYIPVYNDCLKVLLDKWTVAANKEGSVLVFDSICLLSLDIILQCAFSFKSECQTTLTKVPYVKAVFDLAQLSSDRFFNLWHTFDWIYYFTSDGRRYRKACKVAHDFAENVIEERKKSLGYKNGRMNLENHDLLVKAKKERKYLDFLDILLTATDEDGEGLTDLEIRDEADTFMFEGHDTTTSGMSWTLYLLAKHPEHQEKVREEVRNVLMGREWLEYDDLKDLKYTLWCIKEAMRLYPPVYRIIREASDDIELDGHVIPKGAVLAVLILAIHRHPDNWENPNEFDPLRFHPTNVEGRDPYAYIPFSAGQRNCIGQNFALNEEKTVVASIINRFELSVDEDHKVEMHPRVILHSKNDIRLKLKPLSE